MIATYRHALIGLALVGMLSGCGGGDKQAALDNLDSELVDTGNTTDPAVTGALQSQIMVDPTLANQRNGNAVRPPGQPYSAGVPPTSVAARPDSQTTNGEQLMKAPAPVPAGQCSQCKAASSSQTLGALAARQPDGRTSGCADSLNYSASWAQRLPADMPLYPGANVIEAAGSTTGQCRLRVVSFSTTDSMDHMLDWYYTRAIKGGYTAQHQVDGSEHILGGTRARDDGAYVAFMKPRADGGTDIDLIANNGN